MASQCDDRIFIHRIDSRDWIIFVNDAWLAFARENKAPELSSDMVLNRPLWYFIADLETQHLYKIIITKVRTTGAHIKIPFRCDSPDCRRFMELEVLSSSEGVVDFRGRMLRQDFRHPIDLLDPSTERSKKMLTMCSICKKVKLHGKHWCEVEEAVDNLDLFGPQKPPPITHGICPACVKKTRHLISA